MTAGLSPFQLAHQRRETECAYSEPAQMTQQHIQKFHPSVRKAVASWLEHAVHSDGAYKEQVAAKKIEAIERYPALALARAFEVAHPRAMALWWCDVPLEKIRKASRIGIGPEVPASRLRVRMGRKYPIVFVAPEDDPTQSAKGDA